MDLKNKMVMLSHKERKLLDVLYESQSHYLSSQQLATQLGVSERTVRHYLANLTDELMQHGATITSKYGSGYCLSIQQRQDFLQLMDDLKQAKEQERLGQSLNLAESADREYYLLRQLFFQERSFTNRQVRELLHLSRTSVVNLFSSIKAKISDYSLDLSRKADNSYSIRGSEVDKRRFMVDYFLENPFANGFLPASHSQEMVTTLDFSQIAHLILRTCKEAHLTISDYMLSNLVLHIAMMVLRIQTGHTLEEHPLMITVKHDKRYQVAQAILDGLSHLLDLDFPQAEVANIALHLVTKSQSISQDEQVLPFDAEQSLKAVLTQMDKAMGSHFAEDRLLLHHLLAHFGPVFLRLKYHIRLDNPLTKDVKTNYQDFFWLTKNYVSQWKYLRNVHLSDDEWAYLTLHIIAAFERSHRQIKALVVCATGFGSAQVLKNRLQNEFSQKLLLVDCISYHELSDDRLKNIDLIISSIELGDIFFKVPVVTVSVFLTTADITKVSNSLKGIQASLPHCQKVSKEKIVSEQDFDSCFSLDKFLVIAQPIGKEELLRKMIACLEKGNEASFNQEFYQLIKEREALSSTAFSSLSAFPHGIQAIGTKEEVVVAILRHPLAWDQDHQAVQLVFLLSPSRFENKHLRHVSAQLAQFANRPGFQKTLIQEAELSTLKELYLTL